MHPFLEKAVARWVGAGLMDAAAAARVRAFEEGREAARGPRWPVALAAAFGSLLLGAGVLLFVAAHWDALSRAARFSLVLGMVALFHVAGAGLASRHAALSTSLHAAGTACMGAGIFLAGQIFNLREHWPGGLLLWALGAGLAWAVLREWPQAALAFVLAPVWLSGEWIVATESLRGGERVFADGILLTAITYLSALTREADAPIRRALAWIGALAFIPATLFVALGDEIQWELRETRVPPPLRAAGWAAALGLPLILAWFLRGRAAWINLLAGAWVLALGSTRTVTQEAALADLPAFAWRELGPYALCLAGSAGLVGWGLMERRRERVNLGMFGFGLTVLVFYFSSVMDKLGRSTSLIGLGVLFLAGGWILERQRRRLVARLAGGGA